MEPALFPRTCSASALLQLARSISGSSCERWGRVSSLQLHDPKLTKVVLCACSTMGGLQVSRCLCQPQTGLSRSVRHCSYPYVHIPSHPVQESAKCLAAVLAQTPTNFSSAGWLGLCLHPVVTSDNLHHPDTATGLDWAGDQIRETFSIWRCRRKFGISVWLQIDLSEGTGWRYGHQCLLVSCWHRCCNRTRSNDMCLRCRMKYERERVRLDCGLEWDLHWSLVSTGVCGIFAII